MKELLKRLDKFNKEMDWDKYHSPINLAKSVSIEAGELLECFQWNDEVYEHIGGEFLLIFIIVIVIIFISMIIK